MIELTGKNVTSDHPAKVTGIAVDQTVARLYVLHAAHWARLAEGCLPGTAIAEYRVRYKDHRCETFPVVAGQNTFDWWNWDAWQPLAHARVGWVGINEQATAEGRAIRLYVAAWRNPYPEKKVASVDYFSKGTIAAPFCVAITIEETSNHK